MHKIAAYTATRRKWHT